MERLAKRMVTKDGKFRVSVYYDDYACSPRYSTDEPMHCEDWSRNYSIMNKSERETKSPSAQDLIIYLLMKYGKREAVIGMLVENGKHMEDGKNVCNNALVYDRSMRRWVLKQYGEHYVYETRGNERGWFDADYFDGRKDDIDLAEVLESCLDSTIDEVCDKKYWTDEVKMASYGFGYNGEVTFYDDPDTRSYGIAWLEKDEFLKYSGCSEDYWKDKTFSEIEWLGKEIEAWSNGECYIFCVEESHRIKVTKEYIGEDKEDEHEEIVEWEEIDSCGGFYDLDYAIDYACYCNDFEKADLVSA